MATIKGQHLRLFIGNKCLMRADSCQFSIQAIATDSSTKDTDAEWKEINITSQKWSVESGAMVTTKETHGLSQDDIMDMVGERVNVHLSLANGDKNTNQEDILLAGYGIINDVKITGNNKRTSTYTVSITGKGRITIPEILADKNSIALESRDGALFTV